MGQVIFTPLQKIILDEFSKNNLLRNNYYFGGGTALSVFYLHHRYSEDLDFFSAKPLNKEFLIEFINGLAKKLNISVKMTKKETVLLFELQQKKEILKVDFLHFPYQQIEKGRIFKGIVIDSAKDIGANKLMTINLRQEVKDYVDLYFLLKEKYSLWDLLYAVESKYKLQLDLIGLGEDFFEVERFEYLPHMIKSLTLSELKDFFKELARQVGKKTIKT